MIPPRLAYLLALTSLMACASTPDPAASAEVPSQPTEISSNDDPVETLNGETTEPATELAADAEPIWQLVDGGLQHLASGFICLANVGDFSLSGDETYPGLPPGKDVACIYDGEAGGAVKLHLTDFGRAVSPSAHMKGTTTTISDTYSVTGPAPVPLLDGQAHPAESEARSFRLAAKSELRPDVPVDTAIWIRQIGPWHIKARATYETDRSDAVATLIDALYKSAQDNIAPPP